MGRGGVAADMVLLAVALPVGCLKLSTEHGWNNQAGNSDMHDDAIHASLSRSSPRAHQCRRGTFQILLVPVYGACERAVPNAGLRFVCECR